MTRSEEIKRLMGFEPGASRIQGGYTTTEPSIGFKTRNFNHTLAGTYTCKLSLVNFTILRSSPSTLDLTIYEALHIRAKSPRLNERLALNRQSILPKLFIQCF